MSTATLINVILDQSGSMELKKGDVIGGFNRFLDEQKAQPGECRLSLVTFSTEKTVIHAALPIADVPPLTAATYAPGGMTALLDALAEGVRLADKHKQAAERVLCLVITDGEENSSRETTLVQAREIIKAREALGDWTFTYLGISPEKWADSHPKGMWASRAREVVQDRTARRHRSLPGSLGMMPSCRVRANESP